MNGVEVTTHILAGIANVLPARIALTMMVKVARINATMKKETIGI